MFFAKGHDLFINCVGRQHPDGSGAIHLRSMTTVLVFTYNHHREESKSITSGDYTFIQGINRALRMPGPGFLELIKEHNACLPFFLAKKLFNGEPRHDPLYSVLGQKSSSPRLNEVQSTISVARASK